MAKDLLPLLDSRAIARFWSYVDRRGEDECWPWIGSGLPKGYGTIYVGGGRYLSTHVALELAGVPRNGAAMALHSCDNPPCCNAKHLRWGTALENSADMVARGRNEKSKGPDSMHPRGDQHWSNFKPECVARGLKNGKYTKPESTPRGVNHGMAKLSDADVIAIRNSRRTFGSGIALAAQYGVTGALISAIRKGKVWRHLP